MPIAFDQKRLPAHIEGGAQWGLLTLTEKPTGYGGGQVRYAKQRPLWRASIVISPLDAGEMIKMVYRQIGPKFSFRARCHPHFSTWDLPDLDTALTKRVSDGTWPLQIDYGDEERGAVRRIIAPIVDDDFVVYKDGVEVDPANYDVLSNGRLQPIDSPDQGWEAADITWAGTFDCVMNIDSDESLIRMLSNKLSNVSTTITETPFDLTAV